MVRLLRELKDDDKRKLYVLELAWTRRWSSDRGTRQSVQARALHGARIWAGLRGKADGEVGFFALVGGAVEDNDGAPKCLRWRKPATGQAGGLAMVAIKRLSYALGITERTWVCASDKRLSCHGYA